MLGLYTNFCFTRNMSLKCLYILSLKFFLDYIFMSFEVFGEDRRGEGTDERTDLYTYKSLISEDLKLPC